MTGSNEYTNWFDIIAIIDQNHEEHKSINYTNIISEYFYELSIRNDKTTLLDEKFDSCVQLRLVSNADDTVESKQYILFIDDFNQLNNCDGLRFNVISEYHLFNQSYSFQIMHLKLNKDIRHRQSMRRLLSNTWIAPTSQFLPRHDVGMAIGYYKGVIYMFGGHYNQRQITEYHIATNSMIDQGQNNLSINVWGHSQYYTQIDRLMYWINGDSGSNISVYDLQNKQFFPGQITDIPTTVTSVGCLASSSSDNLLFVVGGYNGSQTLATLQICNLSSGEWFFGADMIYARYRHACIVDPKHDKLYAIGGSLTPGGIATSFVETILITDILSDVESINFVDTKWISNPSLVQDINHPIAVLNRNYIYAIGGFWYCDGHCPDYKVERTVQIINCNDGTVTAGSRLNYAIYLPAAISVNHQIYAFGGVVSRTGNMVDITDKWQYMDLPTLAPTLLPTKFPSGTPTENPTENPTEISTMPTKMPSKPPTLEPTQFPTLEPTYYPPAAITSTITTHNEQTGEISGTSNRKNNPHNYGKSSTMNTITIIIIIVAILLCCFIIIMIFMLYSKRRKQQQRQKTEEQMEKHIEMPPTSTASSPSPSNKSVNHNIENDIDITKASYVTPGLYPTTATTTVGVKEPDDLSLYRSEGRKTQSKLESTVMLEMININSNKNEPLIEENINPMYGNENENDNGLWGNNNNTATGMDGENVNDDEKEKVLLEGILSDIMEMDDLDPNKIHQIHVNNIEHKENNESESEASDNMYEKSESNNENSMIHQDVVTAGGEEYKDDNGEQLLDGMLSDIMNMDDLDPNKIHQMHVNNGVNKQMNNESDSDNSDNMYEQSENNMDDSPQKEGKNVI